MTPFFQNSFTKMNRRKDPSQLAQGEYALIVNGRVRNGGVEPIKLPTKIVSLPAGKIQGIYGFDKYLLVFADGKAYVRDYTVSDINFYQVAGFQMSADADTIYACSVPASTVNNKRIPATDTTSGNVITSAPVQLFTGISNSPACVVCQDGTTQPFVIFPDGTARVTQAYNDWQDAAIREYVPVGKQMYYSPDGILYLVGQDNAGRYTYILHSVSGRPLDFMVVVDTAGNKLATEAEGGASAVAYSVDYGEITCLSGIAANAGAFFASTVKASYLVTPNFTNTIYGEPTFQNQALFSTGAINNFSLIDLLGDSALIDFNGIKSFNGIINTRVEGRNAPFSADIQPLFGSDDVSSSLNIVQSITSATSFNDYGHFAVTTLYGPAILIYDTVLPEPSFVSMDLYPDIGNIMQFASIKTLTTRALFFVTSTGDLYQAYVGTTATAELYVGEWTPATQGCEIKPSNLNLTLVDVAESGTIYASSFVDSTLQNTLQELVQQTNVVTIPSQIRPFGDTSKDRVRNPTFNFDTVAAGWKVGFYITWNFKAKLILAQLDANVSDDIQSFKEQARGFTDTQRKFGISPNNR